MLLKYGNLMYSLGSYTDVCITTNSFVKKDGTLVMGRGFAKQMADWDTRIPWFAGQEILKWNQEFSVWDGLTEIKGTPDPYGFLPLNELERSGRGIAVADRIIRQHRIHLFQVKEYWGDDATLELVKHSVDMMQAHVRDTERFGRTFALNYPAIGNGKLRKSDVEPIIAELPDNVHVWQYHEDPWSDEALGDDAEIDRYADERETHEPQVEMSIQKGLAGYFWSVMELQPEGYWEPTADRSVGYFRFHQPCHADAVRWCDEIGIPHPPKLGEAN